MADKPILFNTEMVKAILYGRKTTTRRLLKQPFEVHPNGYITKPRGNERLCPYEPPYKVGDTLWVRETFYPVPSGEPNTYVYKADGTQPNNFHYWKPSIHMPHSAARLFLKVTDVRVERLNDMYVDDAINEGAWGNGQPTLPFSLLFKEHPTASCNAIASFAHIWDSTIKKSDLDRYGWDANPWVWVIAFEGMR